MAFYQGWWMVRAPGFMSVQIPVPPVPLAGLPVPVRRRRPLIEFWKEELACERRVLVKKSKMRVNRLSHRLKRLQQRCQWNRTQEDRKVERADRLEGREERHRLKIVRGKRKPASETCPLWNCRRKRKRGQRRDHQGCSTASRFRRSGTRSWSSHSSRRSQLTNMSLVSRSPVRLRTSPILNDAGFPVHD